MNVWLDGKNGNEKDNPKGENTLHEDLPINLETFYMSREIYPFL
jgi:hypothetical protein